eukprot:1554454-Rhodomonas_salina.1
MGDPVFAPVWQSVLEHSDLGYLKDRMLWERDLMLSRFNKNWNDNKALGITTPQLRKRQEQWLAQIVRSLNRQGLNALVEVFIVAGNDSSLQDVFRGILTNKYMVE